MEENIDLNTIGAEVYEVLENIPKEDYYKIPKEITSLFENFKGFNAIKKIDPNKSFSEQNISQDAKDIIFYISLNYWLSEDQRNEAIKKLEINEKIFNEKYSVENLFKDSSNVDGNKNVEEAPSSSVPNSYMMEHKESLLSSIIHKIRSLFHSK